MIELEFEKKMPYIVKLSLISLCILTYERCRCGRIFRQKLEYFAKIQHKYMSKLGTMGLQPPLQRMHETLSTEGVKIKCKSQCTKTRKRWRLF